MKKIILTVIAILGLISISVAQDEILARSYFKKAQEAYSEGQNNSAIGNLKKTIEYLGATNAKIESLFVKIAVSENDTKFAYTHIKKYFDLASDDHSEYDSMVALYADIKDAHDAIAQRELEIEKENIRRQQEEERRLLEQEKQRIQKIIDAHDFSAGPAVFDKDGKYGFISQSGEIVVAPKYDEINITNKGYYLFLNNKIGFATKSGDIQIKAIYDDLTVLEDGYFIVKQNQKEGLLNINNNKIVIPVKYDNVINKDEGYFLVLDNKYGFASKSGKVMIESKYDFATEFSEEGFSIFGINEKYGVLNTKGEFVIPLEYDNIDFQKLGISLKKKQQSWVC